MPRAKTPRTPRPKAAKAANKTVETQEVVASGNGNGNHFAVDRESEIRIRAYELYESRGSGEGQADEDWLQAEREVMLRHG